MWDMNMSHENESEHRDYYTKTATPIYLFLISIFRY